MKALLGTLIFTVLAPGPVLVGVPYLLVTSGLELSFAIGNLRFIGIIPIAIGTACYIWTAWDFVFTGKGTPAPVGPPKMLVSRRLYRIVRNPMYIGVLLILVGEVILFMSWTLLAYAGLVWFLFHLFVVFYEEPNLRKKFGASYEEYRNSVPRWIPRVKRAKLTVE